MTIPAGDFDARDYESIAWRIGRKHIVVGDGNAVEAGTSDVWDQFV